MPKLRRVFYPLTVIGAGAFLAMFAAPPAAQPAPFPNVDLRHVSFSEAATAMQQTAVIVSLLVVWIFAAIIVTLISGREVRSSSVELRAAPLHCLALGLVAVTSFVLTAILFSYLVPFVVGVPLLLVLGVFAILSKAYGMIVIFHALGTLVAGARTREQLERRRWLRGDIAMVLVGLLLLGAIRLIPIFGTLLWVSASVFGIGVALATKFGRREPWFLAWTSPDVSFRA